MSRMITRALRRATLSSSGMPSPRKREKERPRKVLGDVTNHSRRRKSKYTRILYKTVHKMVRFKETNQELKKTQTENDKRKGGKNNGHREEPKTPHRVIDIDSPHGKGSPQCPELAKSIVEHWLQQEQHFRSSQYFDEDYRCGDVKDSMRTLLIGWLVEVADNLGLQIASYFSAINLLDRVTPLIKPTVENYQLVGCTCLLLACKFEEVSPPTIIEICAVTHYAYSIDQMISMESKMVATLQYHIYTITAFTFLPRFLQAGECCKMETYLTQYLLELCTICYDIMIAYDASQLTASAIYIVRTLSPSHTSSWSMTLQFYTSYTPPQLETCVEMIMALYESEQHKVHERSGKITTISKKYATVKYGQVSTCRLLHW